MAIDYPTLGTAVSAVLIGGAAFYQFRTARRDSDRAQRDGANKVTNEAFNVAKSLWEISVKESKDRATERDQVVAELRHELAEARRILTETRQELEKEKTDRKFLQVRVHELELTVGRLEAKLREAGIAINLESEE